MVSGALLAALLASGAADPVRAGPLRWASATTEGWALERQEDEWTLLRAPHDLPTLPWTLELQTGHQAQTGSVWGLWITDGAGIRTLVISSEGYYSVSLSSRPHWIEFMHIVKRGSNRLYLDAQPDSRAVLRINDETAWAGSLKPGSHWGIALFRQTQLPTTSIQLYAPR